MEIKGYVNKGNPSPVNMLDIRQHGENSSNLRDELVSSLTKPRPLKAVPSILLWDDRGLELFDEITTCPDYYPTRAELALLDQHSDDIVTAVGQNRIIIELGAGYDFLPSPDELKIVLSH